MSDNRFENCAKIVNNAANAIAVDRDPNFDDMILVIDGARQKGSYMLPAGKSIHVGATYSDEGAISYDPDMGLCLGYQGDERYMEVGLSDGSGSSAERGFVVISDSEDGDADAALRYAVTDRSKTSITLTFSDNR